MTYQHPNRITGAFDLPVDGIDPDFDACQIAEDDYLDRCLLELRESSTEFRNL